MVLTRVSFDLEKVLGTTERTQNAAMKRAGERRLTDAGVPQRAEEKETFENRMASEELARQQEKAYVSGKKDAMEKYRITDECPNADCQRHGVRYEVDPDGNAVCPRCGSTKEHAEEEMPSGETQIVNCRIAYP